MTQLNAAVEIWPTAAIVEVKLNPRWQQPHRGTPLALGQRLAV
ncbi:hypothetical protein I545_5718 [Mycobacterium kansasii 662]|uniref:Uncharacterized protein n=2 Tax=Mycobacterium kansasii TaxID=1768 RepID=A0A1V3X6R2_MYCKA|nr:hypothetical protein I547_6823 [Mycobacterium kansasii 824]EUA10427.1 hypothetical protein I545_5718 [Mycobacterium kansasii 662]KEP41095.1 hypothetical protein MKSMC1_37570 [Mycobacterium kansasii]OOK74830.1 hypothetical protein BZL29_4649 [Mycobacterium kansasii]